MSGSFCMLYRVSEFARLIDSRALAGLSRVTAENPDTGHPIGKDCPPPFLFTDNTRTNTDCPPF